MAAQDAIPAESRFRVRFKFVFVQIIIIYAVLVIVMTALRTSTFANARWFRFRQWWRTSRAAVGDGATLIGQKP